MKKRLNKNIFVMLMLVAILVVSLGATRLYLKTAGKQEDNENLTIVTSFFPMYIATENIVAGVDGITLENLSEPQTGCLHDYQLTPADMKLLSTADVFIVNGGGIEGFLTDIAKEYPDLIIIDASEGLDLIEEESAHDHNDEEDDEHVHDADEEAEEHDYNSHAWMSVKLHRQQIANITTGLMEVESNLAKKSGADVAQLDAKTAQFEANASSYDDKLLELQEQQEKLLQESTGKNIVIFHEAYEYVAQDYGMNVSYLLDLDEERQVSAGEVADVMNAISTDKVSFVLAEEEYGADMGARVTEETGVPVYYLNTLVRGTYDANSYIEKMQENINIIEMALGIQND